MKLSKAQQEVMDDAKKTIDFARAHTLHEWAERKTFFTGYDRIVSNYMAYGYNSPEDALRGIESQINRYAQRYGEYYKNERQGIVLTHCNSRTLEKLARCGLIEILYDSKGARSYGIDNIKVLNY